MKKSNLDLESTDPEVVESSMETLIDAAHEIMEKVVNVVDAVNGSEVDVVEIHAMALGLTAGRLGFSRGGMLEIVLDWFDQGLDERQEYLANPDIEVELEEAWLPSEVKKVSN